MITTPRASANDVLSEIQELYISVTYEVNGTIKQVYDVNNLELTNCDPTKAYTFKTDGVGDYKITYYVKDSCGNEVTAVQVVTVTLRVKPKIELSEGLPEEIKINTELVVPTANVEFALEDVDNVSFIVYITPSNSYEFLEDDSFIVNEEGVYRIRYYALDTLGNYVLLEYEVLCKK